MCELDGFGPHASEGLQATKPFSWIFGRLFFGDFDFFEPGAVIILCQINSIHSPSIRLEQAKESHILIYKRTILKLKIISYRRYQFKQRSLNRLNPLRSLILPECNGISIIMAVSIIK